MCLLHKDLLDLSISQGQAGQGLFTLEALKCITNPAQAEMVKHTLKKRGVVSITGGFGTGKSALVVAITQALLNVGPAIKAEKEKAKFTSIAKVHTIEEILAMEKLEDESEASSKVVFPWHQPGFLNVYDQNDRLVKSNKTTKSETEYERAKVSDKHVTLKHQAQDQADPPSRVLIVSPSSNAIDQLLDCLEPLSKQYSIVRVGQSLHRADLNKRYSIDF
jgi:energy-coupling factor transporter ATP-binding protein EcfA2